MSITTLGHAVLKLTNPQDNRSEDNSIEGIQNTGKRTDLTKSGYAIAEGTETTPVGTLAAGVLIPIHNSQPVVATSAEVQTGKVKQSSIIKKGGSLVGDGTLYGDMGTIDITSWTTFYSEGWFFGDSGDSGVLKLLWSIIHSGSDDIRFVFDTLDKLNFALDDGTVSAVVSTNTYRDDKFYFYKTSFDGVNLNLKIYSAAGILLENISNTGSFDFAGAAGTFTLLGRGASLQFQGETHDIIIAQTESSKDHRYNLTETEGDQILDSGASETKINGVVTNGNPAQRGTSDLSVSTLLEGFSVAAVSDGVDDYVDTGVVPDETTIIETYAKPYQNDTAFGVNDNYSGNKRVYPFAVDSLGKMRFGLMDELFSSTIDKENWVKTRLDLITSKAYINDIEVHAFSTTISGVTKTLHMFAIQADSIPTTSFGICDFGYCKIWKGGILVRYFIPLPNGTLKDIIDDTIYTNQGTGDLGVKYIPADLANPTKDVLGNTLQYPTNSFGASEHSYILPDTYECIALDEASGTAYWTDGAGTVIEVDLSTIPENDADFKFTDISNDPVKINHIMRYTAATGTELQKIKNKLNIT